MLKKCAPGYGWARKDHYIQVSYKQKTYYTLPTGAHNSKGEIERGHVRKMAKHLEILECAKSELPLD